jgi:hypothetical protein
VVLTIAVMYRQSALYLAWVILPAGQPGSWKGPWLQLLEVLKGHIPADWTVLVLADRGLYAPWLYQAIIDNGWHPFLRIRRGGTFRAKGSKDFKPLRCLAPQVGSYWCGQGTCFKHRPLTCTLLVCWEAGYEGPWFIITDLAPEQADASWYGLRAWIEVGFKHTKRAGWHWHRTRISDPERASRIWLAMAVATLWVMQVASQVQDQAARENPEALAQAHIARRSRKRTLAPRLLSCFRQGLLSILTALISGRCLPLGYLCPQPWPCSAHSPPTSLPLAA